MKKYLPLFILSALFILPQSVYAGLSEGCFPIVQCDPGQDFYGGSCQTHIETLADCPNPGAPTKFPAFSCDAGCYEKNVSVPAPPPTCPGGVEISGTCLIKLDILDDDVDIDSVGNAAYKIWDGANLTEVVHVGTAGCADDEVAVSDAASSTGWKCEPQTGIWSLNGSKIYYNGGFVGIGTNDPAAALHILGSGFPSSFIYMDTTADAQDAGMRFYENGNVRWHLFNFNAGDSLEIRNTAYDPVIVGTQAGNVGIGTNTPNVKLDVEVSAGGAATIGSSGNSATGNYAIATGFNTTAGGANSTAMGSNTTASGAHSTALGNSATASQNTTFAAGFNVTASGDKAIAMGTNGTTASGQYSMAFGYNNLASGSSSIAMGTETDATGIGAFATGNFTTAQSFLSTVFGRYNVISGSPNSWVSTDPLFIIGNGNFGSPSNAVTVLKNGRVGIGTTNPAAKLHATGDSYGVWGEGSTMGGRFKDSNATGYSYVGYGDYGIQGFGNSAGAYFNDLNNSDDHVYLSSNGWSVNAFGPINIDESGQPALYVSSAEALWYDGDLFSWGYGGNRNYFADSVGIGTSAPNAKLHVTSPGYAIRSYGSTAGGYFEDYTSSGFAYLGWGDYGVFGAGSTAGGYFNNPSGPNNWAYLSYGSNYSLYGGGLVRGVGAYINGSDARLKKNVKTIDGALDKVLSLRGVEYEWKDQTLGEGKKYGFIAQEAEKVVPELVIAPSNDSDTEEIDREDPSSYYGMEYGNTTALLTEAIKELKAEKDTEIAELKSIICELKPDAKVCIQ